MKIYFVLAFLFIWRHLSELEGKVIHAAAGSDVKFPGPHNPQNYRRVVWVFSDHIRSDIVVFTKGSKTNVEVRKKYKNRIQYEALDFSFVLQNVQEPDSGIYNLISRRFARVINEVTLHVFKQLDEPDISSNSSLENSFIALTCILSGNIQSIRWLAITGGASNARYTLINNNTTLVIKNAQKSDSGIYGCFIQNPFSESSAFYELTVKYPAEMVVIAGDSVLFPSPEKGRPNSQTAWTFVTRNHMEIIRYEATHITISKPAPTYEKRILYYSDMRTFVLTQVREDDSGIYEYIDLSTKTRLFTVHLHVYGKYWTMKDTRSCPRLTSEEVVTVFHCDTLELAISEFKIISCSYEGVFRRL
ncbi:cell adhesion molecule CEACAM6-like [Chiloscyllium punctatum]|uniref:cell adhesion molecule CEACAM6-like n=1 Tax=Chiloscyllium punctatum TaxID=137246 RepID=UPI003B6387BD